MTIEYQEKPITELTFFSEKLNLSPDELEEMMNFANILKEKIDTYPECKGKEEEENCLNQCREILKNYFRNKEDKDEINLLLPLSACKKIISVLRVAIIDFFCSKENEERKDDFALIIDEALSNVFTHCKKESEYGVFSIKKEDGKIKNMETMNFSDEEVPEEVLSFLNSPQEKKKEALENFLNNDIEKINNNDFNPKGEIEGEYKKRGLEIIAQLTKNIKYEKIEAGEFGFLNKFTFEV